MLNPSMIIRHSSLTMQTVDNIVFHKKKAPISLYITIWQLNVCVSNKVVSHLKLQLQTGATKCGEFPFHIRLEPHALHKALH